MGRTKTIGDNELLEIARKIFREHGHTAATRDIAAAAGVSQAVLYQRFGSKEDLFLRAMAPEIPDLEVLLGPYPPRSAKADLARIAERLADFLRSHMPTLLHVLANPDLHAKQLRTWHERLPFRRILHGLAARLDRMRTDGLIRRVNPMATAQLILSSVHTSAFLETMLGDHHGTSQLPAVIEVLWSGLAPDD